MPTTAKTTKAECLNPNTGGRMNIDKAAYDLISKAIYYTLKKKSPLTFAQITEGVHDCLKQQGVKFAGSVGWYTITVKKDMEARGIIDVVKEKGKTLNRLSK